MTESTAVDEQTPLHSLPGLTKNRRILVVDDNRTIHEDFRKILIPRQATADLDSLEADIFGDTAAPAIEPFEIESAFQGEEAYKKVVESTQSGRRYALAFVDMRMPPGWDGVQTIEKIWTVDPELQIVICTAYSDYSWEDLVKRFGSADRLLILKKPFDTAEVCQLATALTEKWFLSRHAHLKLQQLRSMVDERTRDLRAANESLEREVVERRRSQEALRESEERYALAAAGANDGLWDWDLDRATVFYSTRWSSMLGLDLRGAEGTAETWFGRVHADDLPGLKAELATHLSGEQPQFSHENRVRHSDGQYRWMLTRGLAVRDASGKARRIAGSQTDITDRKMAEEQLRFDSFHDPLTGLPNRALLAERLGRSLLRKTRDPKHRSAVLFIDLDGFKRVNDTLGHLAGDRLLVGVAGRLTACVRTIDTVGVDREQSVTRLGGDEFVILLDGIAEPVDAFRVAERLIAASAEAFIIDDTEVFAGMSIGIAVSDAYERAEEMLRDADAALYHAKSAGKGRYLLFDPTMHEAAAARWKLEGDLRRAVERGELRVAYQPICSVETESPVSFEALVRWQHPSRGLVPPGEFVPLAEETGLIVPIGSWILREACRQLREWRDTSAAAGQISISVNVSSRQLVGTGLVSETRRALADNGIPPEMLKLELTESGVMENAATALSVLNELRAMGVRIQLDDFGTGYSSLSRLHQMPIDALKIDRSFVSTMLTEPTSAALANVIVVLAHTLGVRVIAEGVETREQLARLRAMSCDFAQGYLFAKPQSADGALELLRMLDSKGPGGRGERGATASALSAA